MVSLSEFEAAVPLPTPAELGERRGSKKGARVLIWLSPLFALAFVALITPVLPLPAPTSLDLSRALEPPIWSSGGSWRHVLGTDGLGRDEAVRLLWGMRLSLLISATAVAVSAGTGALFGFIAGYYGGVIDFVISRLVDAQLAIPFLLLAMAVVTARGQSVGALIVALSVVGWARYARIMRGEALALRSRPFILGLRVAGVSARRIIIRHVLPNSATTLLVVGTLDVGVMMLTESALSFLGLGVSPPAISWGSMLAEGRDYLSSQWWLVAFPGLAITTVVVAVNLIGDRLQAILDPLASR